MSSDQIEVYIFRICFRIFLWKIKQVSYWLNTFCTFFQYMDWYWYGMMLQYRWHAYHFIAATAHHHQHNTTKIVFIKCHFYQLTWPWTTHFPSLESNLWFGHQWRQNFREKLNTFLNFNIFHLTVDVKHLWFCFLVIDLANQC